MANELFIKVDASDTGARPVPAGTAIWNSPSVWLTDIHGNGIPKAIVGNENVINVQVDSTGKDSKSNVKVQVWVCDYTMGGVGPAAVLTSGSAGGSSGRTGTVLTDVSANAPGIARVSWTPLPSDLINTSDPKTGHVCAGANTYVEGAAPEGAIKSSGLLDVVNNQHHAWKNLTVEAKPVGGLIRFSLRAGNAGAEAQEFSLKAFALDPELVMGQVEQEMLLTAGFVDLLGADEPARIPLQCMTEPWERTRLARGGRLVLRGLPDPVELRPAKNPISVRIRTADGADEGAGIIIAGGDQVPVTLEGRTDGGEFGEVHGVELVQTDGAGNPVGGARLLVVETPPWSCC